MLEVTWLIYMYLDFANVLHINIVNINLRSNDKWNSFVFDAATPSAGQSCPGGWYHFGTSCYAFIDAEPLEWTEAMVTTSLGASSFRVLHTFQKSFAYMPNFHIS